MTGSPPAGFRVTTEAEARGLLGELGQVMQELAAVMAAESAHLSAGRVRAGLAEEGRKTALSAAYLRGIEGMKANAVALARFAPDGVAALKAAHEGFRTAVERNQTVVATARAVAEGLVKAVADDLARQAKPSGYGAGARGAAGCVRASPLVLSARL